MCHPWLAAGIVGFIGVVLARDIGPVLRTSEAGDATLASGLLGRRLREWFRGRIRPLADVMLGVGLTPNVVTVSQLVASIACGIAYAHGWMFTAGWTLIACGTLDVVDGEMARREAVDGPRGAFIDSMVDRCSESAVYLGLVAFYRETWVLWAVLLAWSGAFLVSYARARAESLGADCRDGLLQRPERYVILGLTSLTSALAAHLSCSTGGRHGIVALGLCALAVLAHATALQRARATMGKLP